MGKITNESTNVIHHPPEAVYDFVTNPANWGRTYKGSDGVHAPLSLPLKVGDVWTETVVLPSNTYSPTWTLITAVRPRKWVFQQYEIGCKADVDKKGDESDEGVDGICTIAYTLQPVESGKATMFHRSLTIELPPGVDMPDDLLTVSARPAGIDRYHAAIEKELDNQATKDA